MLPSVNFKLHLEQNLELMEFYAWNQFTEAIQHSKLLWRHLFPKLLGWISYIITYCINYITSASCSLEHMFHLFQKWEFSLLCFCICYLRRLCWVAGKSYWGCSNAYILSLYCFTCFQDICSRAGLCLCVSCDTYHLHYKWILLIQECVF